RERWCRPRSSPGSSAADRGFHGLQRHSSSRLEHAAKGADVDRLRLHGHVALAADVEADTVARLDSEMLADLFRDGDLALRGECGARHVLTNAAIPYLIPCTPAPPRPPPPRWGTARARRARARSGCVRRARGAVAGGSSRD